MNSHKMPSTGPAMAAMRSADDYYGVPSCQNSSPCAASPVSSSVLVIHKSMRLNYEPASEPLHSGLRTVSCPRRGSLPAPPSGAAFSWRSHPNFSSSFESTFSRTSLQSCCENRGSSFEPTTPPRSTPSSPLPLRRSTSSPHSLATVRLGLRAKKLEKFVQARAAMKQRLVDYRSLCQQEAQPQEIKS